MAYRTIKCAVAWAFAVVILSASLFAMVRYQPFLATYFDWPILRKLNDYVCPVRLINRAVHGISELAPLTGILLAGLLWYVWFRFDSKSAKEKLVLGLGAAVAAVILSRGMQILLPTHLRPLHDPELGFRLPPGIDPASLSRWSSFPSDHACIYFALAAVIWRRSRSIGLFALLPALLGSLPRIYFGFHYPSDVVFGALLGVFIVVMVEDYGPERLACRVVTFSERNPSIFYLCGFVLTTEVGLLFYDVRKLAFDLLQAIGYASL